MAEAFEVGVSEELIVVRQPAVHFYAIYAMASDPPQLKLTRRAPTKAPKLLAASWQAANQGARARVDCVTGANRHHLSWVQYNAKKHSGDQHKKSSNPALSAAL